MVENEELLKSLVVRGESGDIEVLESAYFLAKEIEKTMATVVKARLSTDTDKYIYHKEHFEVAHKCMKALRVQTLKAMKGGYGSERHVDLYKACLLFESPHSFDEAILYAEFNRPWDKKFYEPRRAQLKPLVDAFQDLEYRKIRRLLVMMPPGTGKSGISGMFQRWSGGRNPELAILNGSHNNDILFTMYSEMLRMCDKNGEYLWNDIFPGSPLVSKNANTMRIDLKTQKKFSTYEYASLGSGKAGLLRATNVLILDDLVDGIEVATNRERLDKLNQSFSVDYLQRMQGDCALAMIATPWSVHDPIDLMAEKYKDDPLTKIIRMPALNENDESNFNYPIESGAFTTEWYHELRDSMDDASWRALYMMEPVEREGTLYPKEELRRYFSLPSGTPDAIYAVCDTKTTGKDYCVLPIAYQFGEDYFIEDVVCENYAPDVVENSVVMMLSKHSPQMARFESNVAGGKMAQVVQERLKNAGCRTSISTTYTTANKETKIQIESPWVKRHCVFKDDSVLGGEKNKEYKQFMQFLCGYTMAGKNAHDDVPDAMAQLARFCQGFGEARIEVMRRPF